MVRVLIVDDFNRIHEAVSRGRSQSQAPIRIIAQAHCGRTAIVLAQVYHYDVVVLPAILSDLDSIEVLKQIKARSASVGALVYGADSPEAALAAYRAGADGYFPQNREPQELAMAIADVAAGQPYFPHRMPPRVMH
jgi:DNA-binding NarL/FixJ family response regulator